MKHTSDLEKGKRTKVSMILTDEVLKDIEYLTAVLGTPNKTEAVAHVISVFTKIKRSCIDDRSVIIERTVNGDYYEILL